VIDPASKEKKPKKTVENLYQLIAKINRPMKKSRVVALAEEGGHSIKYIAQSDWPNKRKSFFKILTKPFRITTRMANQHKYKKRKTLPKGGCIFFYVMQPHTPFFE